MADRCELSFDPGKIVGVLLSGGLDSVILLGHLLRQGARVQPIYIRCGLVWEAAELAAVASVTQAMASSAVEPLVVLEFPVNDLYVGHWSVTGQSFPGEDSPAEAVFLPARNACLLLKAGVWCLLRGIDELAIGTLSTNPFADAQPEFFSLVEQLLYQSMGRSLRVVTPFGRLTKGQVMELGRELPLELSFSCIAPQNGLHCGQCNKCAERKEAFASAGMVDRTVYYSSCTARA